MNIYLFLFRTVEYAVDTENLSISAIRTIRVLRPLRAINRIPSKLLRVACFCLVVIPTDVSVHTIPLSFIIFIIY